MEQLGSRKRCRAVRPDIRRICAPRGTPDGISGRYFHNQKDRKALPCSSPFPLAKELAEEEDGAAGEIFGGILCAHIGFIKNCKPVFLPKRNTFQHPVHLQHRPPYRINPFTSPGGYPKNRPISCGNSPPSIRRSRSLAIAPSSSFVL